uniref:DNA-directed RNA polymerase n=1 Tax=Mirabilis jalapa TaxID=3538 RepID=A0A7T7FPG5_MIRJA|nr:hypothetical protein KYW51_mgp16 [Mirabilis jalapa]QQL93536.1 hypothetical protein [Mirabilis jalapa]
MSYLLLDEFLAEKTNLIPSLDGQIQDVYSYISNELKSFLKDELVDNNLSSIVCNNLDRKIVKKIFMPMIYGKTVMSTASDLKEHLSHYITHKECFTVASACFKFWRSRFNGMESLIRLIRNIGWVASAKNRPVFYKVQNFTTVQDYMITRAIYIWVYDRLRKKRRRITLRVPSAQRDRRKTEISTFANFIHQKDAHIAMEVVKKMLEIGAPIYTVHENFVSTPEFCYEIPNFYTETICEMGYPLTIINEFIYTNVIKPINDKLPLSHVYPITEEDIQRGMVIHEQYLKDYLYKYKPANLSAHEERFRILN